MNDLILYPAKVSVCMALMYGFYHFALKKDTHFHFNRAYLLASIYISLAIPLLHFTLIKENSNDVLVGFMETVSVKPDNLLKSSPSFSGMYVFFIIYLVGILIQAVSLTAKIVTLNTVRRHSTTEERNGVNIAYSDKQIAPFSFLSTIYIDKSMMENEHLDKIIMHETVHINQLHSLDIIFAEIICMLTWFSPFSWMVKSALKETHEYLADKEVTEQTREQADYFLLLFRNATGLQPGLANNLNKSLTLKRLTMMKKTRSGRLSILKVLPVIPFIAILLVSFSCKNSTNETIAQNTVSNVNEDQTSKEVDKMPEFPGGSDAMTKFIIDNVKYPEEAKTKGIEGKVLVSFIVSKTGNLNKIEVKQKVNDELDAEAIRVVKLMPSWTPGESKGKTVDVEMVLPIQFKLS